MANSFIKLMVRIGTWDNKLHEHLAYCSWIVASSAQILLVQLVFAKGVNLELNKGYDVNKF